MSYIEEFCDSIAIINKGKVAISGDINEIKRNYPRDRLVVKTVDTEKLKKDFEGRCIVENNSVIIKLDNPNEKSETMKTLIEKYDIDEIKVLEPSLNDIFVEYAGEGAK
jgi:ABC-2 type transport system ATP-binding protein